jgi:cytoskeletal protein CcmA (bactofilin family)
VFNRKADQTAQPLYTAVHRIPAATGASPEVPTAATATDAAVQSVIGNDLSIEGQSITIRCKGTLRINGNIQADLHSHKLVVGPQAVVTGSIAANEVDVFGRVSGAIYGTHVRLQESAKVDGDIHSEHLQMEKGASFDGRSRKVADVSEIAPKLEPQQSQVKAAGDVVEIVATPVAKFPGVVTPARDRLHS